MSSQSQDPASGTPVLFNQTQDLEPRRESQYFPISHRCHLRIVKGVGFDALMTHSGDSNPRPNAHPSKMRKQYVP